MMLPGKQSISDEVEEGLVLEITQFDIKTSSLRFFPRIQKKRIVNNYETEETTILSHF